MDVLATFAPGTDYEHSAGLTYRNSVFTIEGAGPTTPSHVRELDAASQLVWRSPNTREWFFETFGSAQPQVPPPAPGPVQTAPAPAAKPKANGVWTFVFIIGMLMTFGGWGLGQCSRMVSTAGTATAAAPAAVNGTYSDGVYLVGTDMPAGRYKGTVAGSQGVWALSRDPNGSQFVDGAVPTGPFYVEAKDGQYLKLAGVTIAPAP